VSANALAPSAPQHANERRDRRAVKAAASLNPFTRSLKILVVVLSWSDVFSSLVQLARLADSSQIHTGRIA
jgi:hypothetical protein